VFLVECGGGLERERFAGLHDLAGVIGEILPVVFEGFVGGVFFPVAAEFSEDIERGGFAERFFKPFIFVVEGLKVGANVGEFVRKLVEELTVVAVLGVEADRDLATRGSLIKRDGTFMIPRDEEGWVGEVVCFWKDADSGFEEGAEFSFRHFETARIDAELGLRAKGEEDEKKERFHFLRLGSRLPRTRAWMRSGQVPSLRRRSQAASMRRLLLTGR